MNDREKWRERVRDIRAEARHDDDDDDKIYCVEKTFDTKNVYIKHLLTVLSLKKR